MIKFLDEKQLNNKSTDDLLTIQKDLRHVITGRKHACKAPRSSDITLTKKYETMHNIVDGILSKRSYIESSKPRRGSDKRSRREGISMKRGEYAAQYE